MEDQVHRALESQCGKERLKWGSWPKRRRNIPQNSMIDIECDEHEAELVGVLRCPSLGAQRCPSLGAHRVLLRRSVPGCDLCCQPQRSARVAVAHAALTALQTSDQEYLPRGHHYQCSLEAFAALLQRKRNRQEQLSGRCYHCGEWGTCRTGVQRRASRSRPRSKGNDWERVARASPQIARRMSM